MQIAKRWGVMALAASLVLGSMGAARADEGPNEANSATETVDPGRYAAQYEWASHFVTILFYFGFGEGIPTDCPPSEPPVGASECVQPSLAGPNGQVNHGSMVSSFVHFLKTERAQELLQGFQDVPKGQLVKQFAHEDFGKGLSSRSAATEDDPDGDLEVEEADETKKPGPPEFVLEKKAAKDAAKQEKKAAKAAGKNDKKDTSGE